MLDLLPTTLHTQLEIEEIVKDYAFAGIVKLFGRLRRVNLPECVGQMNQAVMAAELFRQGILQGWQAQFKGLLRLAADVAVA